MPTPIDPYGAASALFVDLVATADPHVVVPACPAWTVSDLLAHQVHQLAGAVDGSFPVADAHAALVAPTAAERAVARANQDRWIGAGIAARRRQGTDDLLLDWGRLAATAHPRARDALLPDLVVHLFDLLGALGDASHRDHVLVVDALLFWAAQADARHRSCTGRALRLVVPDGVTIGATTDHTDEVHGSAFELLRTITGRRARTEIDIAAEPDTLDCLALYGWRETPLQERGATASDTAGRPA